MLNIEAIPAFNDNYIWCIYHSTLKQALVVDPGDALPVIAFLQQKQLQLTHILVTHHHDDHIGGIDALKNKYNCNVYGPHNPKIKTIDQAYREGDSFELLGVKFNVLEVPGHTLDHIAFHNPSLGEGGALFCGDTLFAGGCGRIFEGNPAMMYQSLQKMAKLPPQTEVYCAHEYTLANLAFAAAVEPKNTALQQRIKLEKAKRLSSIPTLPSTLALELNTNPFIRCHVEEVIDSAQHYDANKPSSAVEVFASIRTWKNHF